MLNDKRFNDIMNSRVKINEGEYINHPNDRGGETKFGISKRWYPNQDIKNLTKERADMILFRDYWKNTNIYQLPDELADIVLDDSIVQGQPTAIKNLQRALGIVDDGIIGSNTLNSIKNTDYKTLKERSFSISLSLATVVISAFKRSISCLRAAVDCSWAILA